MVVGDIGPDPDPIANAQIDSPSAAPCLSELKAVYFSFEEIVGAKSEIEIYLLKGSRNRCTDFKVDARECRSDLFVSKGAMAREVGETLWSCKFAVPERGIAVEAQIGPSREELCSGADSILAAEVVDISVVVVEVETSYEGPNGLRIQGLRLPQSVHR